MTFMKLDPALAKSVGSNTNITEKGAYIGTMKRVEVYKNSGGAEFVEIDFASDDGATARWLGLCIKGSDGNTETFGRKIVHAIMACAKVREVSLSEATIKKWDQTSRQETMQKATIIPELMNKRIGLVLVREEYEGNNGSKWKMAIVTPFDPETQRVAPEILNREFTGNGVMLPRIIESLKDKPLKAGASKSARSAAAHSSGGGSGFDDMDDDIPF